MLSIQRTPSLLGGTLGIIPDWQFSQDPAVNYNLNPNLVMPDGMTQLTVQPVGLYVAGVSPQGGNGGTWGPGSMMNGLGITMVGKPLKPYVSSVTNPLSGPSMFDSYAWQNRKWVVMGAVSAIALGAAALATAALR